MNKKNIGNYIDEIRKNKFFYDAVTLCVILMWFLMMEIAHGSYVYNRMKWNMFILNMFVYISVFFVLYITIKKRWIACLVGSVFFMIFSIINYYVIDYHGTPITYQEIYNIRTALNVVGAYTFSITKRIILIFMIGVIEGIGIWYIRKSKIAEFYTEKRKKESVIQGILLLGIIVSFFLVFIRENEYKEKMTVSWNWNEQYNTCGALPCFIESIVQGMEKVHKPEGYSLEKIEEIKAETTVYTEKEETYPDIILILNETFYDLNQVTDIETDEEYLYNIKELENKITGYAICPGMGGGTNSTEYELLTSNSLQLLGNITPFAKLNMSDANSIVSYLKSIGYNTLGAHPAVGTNYMRNVGYAGLGFDEIYFKENFSKLENYYNRQFPTDQSVYNNVIEWYEQMPNVPKFIYVLTIQNHGEWESNDEKYDLVHVKNNYGSLTACVNEYLTCISMSDTALNSLISYYDTNQKPVVICMVGDHAPYFVKRVADEKYLNSDIELRGRSVPFVIWSNMFNGEQDIGSISMIYLMPLVLQKAGVPLSTYYEYLLNLQQEVPILTSYGKYYDDIGNMYSYEDETTYKEAINDYFILEYNNIYGGKQRVQNIFQ